MTTTAHVAMLKGPYRLGALNKVERMGILNRCTVKQISFSKPHVILRRTSRDGPYKCENAPSTYVYQVQVPSTEFYGIKGS